VIYPSAIRFGNRPVDVDPEEALRELVPQNLALKEARERRRRGHIAQIQSLLPNGVRAIGDVTRVDGDGWLLRLRLIQGPLAWKPPPAADASMSGRIFSFHHEPPKRFRRRPRRPYIEWVSQSSNRVGPICG